MAKRPSRYVLLLALPGEWMLIDLRHSRNKRKCFSFEVGGVYYQPFNFVLIPFQVTPSFSSRRRHKDPEG